MTKRKTKTTAEEQAGTPFERALARRLLDLILADKEVRIHLEARLEHIPKKGDLDSVDLGVCRMNQVFLDWLSGECDKLWCGIDAMPKQGDILDGEKEAKLKATLMGDPEEGVAEPLGPTPETFTDSGMGLVKG